MKHQAHRNKELGGYDYRGYYIEKPEGSQYWNIHKVEDGVIDFCFTEGVCESFKEAKSTVDYMLEDLDLCDIMRR